MALSKSPFISINLLIYLLFVCINSQTIHSKNPLSKKVCALTVFPIECKKVFKSLHIDQATTTIHTLGNITMEKIEKHSQDTINGINERLGGTVQPDEISKLTRCRGQYDYIYHKTRATRAAWNDNDSNALDLTHTTADSIHNAHLTFFPFIMHRIEMTNNNKY
ncbi:hypothetical protein QQ045_008959 [Rhodiola kirilowii]